MAGAMNLPLPSLMERITHAPRRVAWLLAAVAGWLLAMGMPPVASPIAGVAGFALLLLLLAARPARQAFALGLLFGFAHFLCGLPWIAEAFQFQANMPQWMGWVAVAGLSLFLAIYPAFAIWAARRLTARPAPLTLLLAGLFTLTEMLRGTLFTGFAWNPAGALWLDVAPISGLAAYVGANGLSAVALLVAGGLVTLTQTPRDRAAPLLFGLVALLALAGVATKAPPGAGSGTHFLLVQTGTGIAEKNAPGGLEQSLLHAMAATRQGLAEGPVAAVIWPEATVEFPMEELPELRAQLTANLPAGTLLLTGGVALERDAAGTVIGGRNSLYALDGTGRILARYDKAHLVPGGEYLPLRAIAEPLGLTRLVPGALDFLPGDGSESWHLPNMPALAPNICYEIIFPGAIVDQRDRPAAIVTVSNDAWFGRSGPPQHHAQARLRAIEEGLPVLRVTPTGITGLIDANGAMVATLPPGRAGTLRVELPQPRAPTGFSRFGLAAPGLFALLLVAIGALARLPADKKT